MRRDVLPELEQVDGRGADGEEGNVHVGSHLQAEHLGLRVPVHLHNIQPAFSPVLVQLFTVESCVCTKNEIRFFDK